MVDHKYLQLGLWGLGNAHLANTMAGHLGAAVVTGYFFGEDKPQLDEAVYRGIEGELDRIIHGEEAIWFDTEETGLTPGKLFEALPAGEPQPDAIGTIADALSENIDALRQSGHNTIFASIALRALHDHSALATPATVEGIRKLIAAFNDNHAGRGYYGEAKGWLLGHEVELDAATEFPAYTSLQDMVNTTIQELIDTAPIKKQGFGSLWHVINHAAAITELHRFGYHELANKALPAHHHHIQLWRTLPDLADELGPVIKSEHDPLEPVYWEGALKRDQARLTHRVKTLYGYYTIRRFVSDPELVSQSDDALRFLMA